MQERFDKIAATSPEDLRRAGIEGKIKEEALRGVAWRVFLEYFDNEKPSSTWEEQCKALRSEYDTLKDKYMVNPYADDEAEAVPVDINNPLSQAVESPWNQFFQDTELQKEINQDIERTYPENEFFQLQTTRELMLRVLFIYARLHPDVGYKQGMHELLAPIVYTLHRETIVEGASGALKVVLDPAYVEHDAYQLFERVMQTAKPWFVSVPSQQAVPKKKNAVGALPGVDGQDAPEETAKSPVVSKCHRIHHLVLKQKDPQLYQALEAVNIEPQVYALRWVRLLLGREFHLEDVLIIWDALFADGLDKGLIDYICVAMLIFIRGHIIGAEYVQVMRRLFKYPPVEEVYPFVERGLQLRSPAYKPPEAQPKPAPAPASGPAPGLARVPPAQHSPHHAQSPRASLRPEDDRPRGSSIGKAAQKVKEYAAKLPVQPAAVVSRLKAENEHLRTTQIQMATRLDTMIGVFQKEFLEKGVEMSEDTVVFALAELKQCRDVLSQQLDVGAVSMMMGDEQVASSPPKRADPLGAVSELS